MPPNSTVQTIQPITSTTVPVRIQKSTEQHSDLWFPLMFSALCIVLIFGLVLLWRYTQAKPYRPVEEPHHEPLLNLETTTQKTTDPSLNLKNDIEKVVPQTPIIATELKTQDDINMINAMIGSNHSLTNKDININNINNNINNVNLEQLTDTLLKPTLPLIGDLSTLTAQKHPLILEEKKIVASERIEPEWNFSSSLFKKNQPVKEAPVLETETVNQDNTSIQKEPLEPLEPFTSTLTLLSPTPVEETPSFAHDMFHYQVRLYWNDENAKHVLPQVLSAHPWTGALPVDAYIDPHSHYCMILGWQLARRHLLAKAADLPEFQTWCQTIASLSGARYECISLLEWNTLIDEAHSLVSVLDSAIILKLAIAPQDLPLLTQSLLAARFIQENEHWRYEDLHERHVIYLERQWGHIQPNSNNDELIVFQLILDLPHFTVLEARKIYMRLRAIAKASHGILQSVKGTHLSEGTLDRYGREMIFKQEALLKAGIVPGSKQAQSIFYPKWLMNQDLNFK